LEDIRRRLAEYIRIDRANVRVEGPFPVPGDDSRVRFRITICGDNNVDEDEATNDFIARVEGGDDGSFGLESAELGDTTQSSSNSGVQLGVAFVLYIVAAFF
jgi:hypothetical protein